MSNAPAATVSVTKPARYCIECRIVRVSGKRRTAGHDECLQCEKAAK